MLKDNIALPSDFVLRMQQKLGEAYSDFVTALAMPAPVSIRQNPSKKIGQKIAYEPIAWVEDGFYLSERPVFTLDPAFHAGAYYVQEASSMLIAAALKQCVDFAAPLRVLDLCAAPGGKSTLLATLLNEKSLLVTNEVIKSRVSILKENMHKWAMSNVMISNHEAEEMAGLEGFFDIVLIDAPCSGEGLFRKDENARKEWSLDNVQLCAARQRKIIAHAQSLLREGGVLLYSTCTYNADENINNADWIAQQFDFQSLNLNFPDDWGVTRIEKENVVGFQCYPHKVRGEGFFFALLRKNKVTYSDKSSSFFNKNTSFDALSKSDIAALSPWIKNVEDLSFYKKGNGQIIALPKNILGVAMEVERALRRVSFGIELGEFKGKDFIPSHDLALSHWVKEDLQAIELTREDALLFLKKELYHVESPMKGWTLARYNGLNLGWMKILPNRINNYLPAQFRIRMDLDI
jgi:16S rRNA C967 or C1407 C5-methylase (RsmB/RsmF family)/NOL1/NOP2/fmu family ribosome biogenesis protein